MGFNVASFRTTKMMKKIGGTHLRTLTHAKNALKQMKSKGYLIDTIYAGNFKRQPVYTPAVSAIFEVSLPDYIADGALGTDSLCKNIKPYGRVFTQIVEPEHLMATRFYITEDLLHPAREFVLTPSDGFIHEEIAREVDSRIKALERLAQAAARTPKSILSLIKWNDPEVIQKMTKVYAHDSTFAMKPWHMYPHGIFASLLYNLLGKCGLELALQCEALESLDRGQDEELYQSKSGFTKHAAKLIAKLKEGVSSDEQGRIDKFLENIHQEVDNVWWNVTAEYIEEEYYGHVHVSYREPLMVDPDGYHGVQNTETILLNAFGNKTYLITGELRDETLDITPGVEIYEAKKKFAEETGGPKQEELALFMTAMELIRTESKLMRHYARHVRNELFPEIFKVYPEFIFNFAFHERLYIQELTRNVNPNLCMEFRMRTSNAGIMLRETGETNPKAIVLGAEEAVEAMRRKYPTENFDEVENTIKEHLSYFK
jgi:hypothetical protein